MGVKQKGMLTIVKVGDKGMTLVELMFAAVIFSIIALSVLNLMTMSRLIFETNDVYAQLNHNGMQLLHSIERELRQTSNSSSHLVITTDVSNNSVVRFQIPVDHDNDGDVTVSSLANMVEWGAYDEVGQMQRASGADPLDRWVRYSVANNQLIREILDSGLVPVNGLSRVIGNGVQSFTATQNQSMLTLTTVLSATDTRGPTTGSRMFQATFTSQTLLRNVPT